MSFGKKVELDVPAAAKKLFSKVHLEWIRKFYGILKKETGIMENNSSPKDDLWIERGEEEAPVSRLYISN
jgi:hypothetical protein